jgi:uncharacterized protein YutE (UPF0331/DUF86 family)
VIDDVFLNKCAIMERCLKRIDEECRNDDKRLRDSFTVQDSIILNLQRACEASIDLAMHMISKNKLGIPQSSRDAFKILEACEIINSELSIDLQHMVGFRNIAVHDDQELQLPIVISILTHKLQNFSEFMKQMTAYRRKNSLRDS